jgi:PhzF family phenazine biosynthesis protein
VFKKVNLPIYQVDAFTSKTFAGNPAAICPLDEWLPEETMQKIAAENNLAETAFFVKNGAGGYEIRWFSPTVEIPLCGHATLASANVLFDHLGFDGTTIKFSSCSRGDLGVEKQGDLLVLDFPAYDLRETKAPKELIEALGRAPKQEWETQGHMIMLLFENEAIIRSIDPDMNALMKLPYNEVIVTAPGDDADFVSRMFAPKIGIPEDPVTGAIHCSLIPYWAEKLGKTKLYARQVSKRGGELFCELAGDRVKIGGNAALYLKGEIYV